MDKGDYAYEIVCKAVIEEFHFELREIEKFYRIAKIAAYRPTHIDYFHILPRENAIKFCLLAFVPIMIGLRLSDQEKYEAFISGKDATPAYDILLTENMIDSVLSILLEPNEAFSKQSYMYNENKIIVSAKDRIARVYEALFFPNEAENPYGTSVGAIKIVPEVRNNIMSAVSLLSGYASYE